jgi:hypothetical protein
MSSPDFMDNCTMLAAASAGHLNLSIKVQDGLTDPSPGSPALLSFRSPTLGSSAYVSRSLMSASSLSISPGSNMGSTVGLAFSLWGIAIDNGGIIVPGVINCRGPYDIYSLNTGLLISAVAEGGGGANSPGVYYAASSMSGVAFRILNRMEWTNGLAVAGVWQAPDRVEPYSSSMILPGNFVWTRTKRFPAGVTWSSNLGTPSDTPIASGNFTLTSAAHSYSWEVGFQTTIITNQNAIYGNVCRAGVPIGERWIGAYGSVPTGIAVVQMVSQSGSDFPGSVGPHNVVVRAHIEGVAPLGYGYIDDGNGGGFMKTGEVRS